MANLFFIIICWEYWVVHICVKAKKGSAVFLAVLSACALLVDVDLCKSLWTWQLCGFAGVVAQFFAVGDTHCLKANDVIPSKIAADHVWVSTHLTQEH